MGIYERSICGQIRKARLNKDCVRSDHVKLWLPRNRVISAVNVMAILKVVANGWSEASPLHVKAREMQLKGAGVTVRERQTMELTSRL